MKQLLRLLIFGGMVVYVLLVCRAAIAAPPHGVYATAPGSVVEDCLGSCDARPVSALFDIDRLASPATLSAEVVDPLRPLFNDDPFTVTVASDSSTRPDPNTIEFTGEYLPGYEFRWSFTELESGEVVWSGLTAWTGGRFDQTTMSNVVLVAVPEPSAHVVLVCGMAFLSFGRHRLTRGRCYYGVVVAPTDSDRIRKPGHALRRLRACHTSVLFGAGT